MSLKQKTFGRNITDDMGLSDIVNAWFEEEKIKLENQNKA